MPKMKSIHVDQLLSNVAFDYMNARRVLGELVPVIETPDKSGKYVVYSRSDAAAISDQRVGPYSLPNEVDYSVSQGTYNCEGYALAKRVAPEEMRNASGPIDPLARATQILTAELNLGREKRIADLLSATANYASSNRLTAANAWTDKTNGTPLDDLMSAVEALAPDAGGDTQKVLVVGLKAANALRKHPQLLGNGSLRPVVSLDEVADFAGIDRVVVVESEYDSAAPGAAASLARIWPTGTAAIVRLPLGGIGIGSRAFAAAFRWLTPEFGSRPIGVQTYEDMSRGVAGNTVIKAGFYEDLQVVQNDMGAIITNVA